MSENQYNAPAMEVVEFGKEDMFCNTLSSTDTTDFNGNHVGGGPNGPINPWGGGDYEG